MAAIACSAGLNTALARLEIEQLIDEVCLDADGPRQKMGNEHLGERSFVGELTRGSIETISATT
jgi:hypothetical protein